MKRCADLLALLLGISTAAGCANPDDRAPLRASLEGIEGSSFQVESPYQPVACPSPPAGTAAGGQRIRIGSGDLTGIYYAIGAAVCNLYNAAGPQTARQCSVQRTDGSIANLSGVRTRRMELGIAQSDLDYHAYRGSGRFRGRGPDRKLRSVFSAHTEAFTIVARHNAGIQTLDDLVGKRVNIGNPGSGHRSTMEILMRAKGWNRGDFAEVSELTPDSQAEALCDGRIDATVFTVGHPNTSVTWLTSTCKALLVEVVGPEVDGLVAETPYLTAAVIPGGTYHRNPDDVQTFGVVATLMTSADVPDHKICQTVKAVFENLPTFRTVHPAFAELDPEKMVSNGLSAPLHPAAAGYFTRAGLIDAATSEPAPP